MTNTASVLVDHIWVTVIYSQIAVIFYDLHHTVNDNSLIREGL